MPKPPAPASGAFPNRQDERAARQKGILMLLAAVSLFGAVDGISKILVATQSFGQIVLGRYALALPLLLVVTGPRGWRILFRTRRLGLQFTRALAPLVVGGAMVIAVLHLPLAEASVILFAGPFMVVGLSGSVLKERVTPASWIGVAIGFLAVVIVARPGFGGLSIFALFPLVGAVFYALFQLLTRRLAAAGEDPVTTLAWTLAVGTIVAAPLAFAEWRPLDRDGWLLQMALGLTYGVAQLLLVRAFVHAPASVLAPFSYAQIISAAAFGLVVFGDVPDAWTLTGIVMIIAAGAYVMQKAR